MTQAIYDPWQTTFFFSMIANGASNTDVEVPLDQTLPKNLAIEAGARAASQSLSAKLADSVAQSIAYNNSSPTPALGADDWTLVWGPQALCLKAMPDSVHWGPDAFTVLISTRN